MKKNTENKEPKRLKTCHKVIFAIESILLVFAIIFGIYALDYYHADDDAKIIIKGINYGFSVEDNGDFYVFKPDNSEKIGFVFYPGGKVECEAYAPLLGRLAEKGVTCVLLKMPANLAVLNINAARGIQDVIPDIDRWYIGGHSLGGSTAGKYLKKSRDDYAGIILLGSYLADNLSDMDIKALLLYGSKDGIIRRDKLKAGEKYLPRIKTEIVIEGGCHSYFGSYGMQKGDGAPEITKEEQYSITVDEILNFMRKQ
ncbi:MAG: alpha/beta hydrolase [Lachnospiraceae bacterium]|nr:alpha/beta hydrolase [Lachnospiraceae bacterium]